MTTTVRRVVTSEDENGRSTVLVDGAVSCFTDIVEGLRLSDVWMTSAAETELPPRADVMAGRSVELTPPQSGTKFRLFELPPDDRYLDSVTGADLLGGIGASDAIVNSAHPGMHRTPTIDYLVIVRGTVHLILDDGEVELRAGDCVVQGGVSHAWSNRTQEPALVAAVLVAQS